MMKKLFYVCWLSRYISEIGRKITLKERLKRAGELSHIGFRDTSVSGYTMGICEREVGGLKK